LKKYEEIVLNVEKNYYTDIQRLENLQVALVIQSVNL
jgi:hypothetical protein